MAPVQTIGGPRAAVPLDENWRSVRRFPHPLILIDHNQAIDLTAPAYAALTTYATGAVVTFGSMAYTSLQNANTGHQPDISPLWWVASPVPLTDAYNQPLEATPKYTPFYGRLWELSSSKIRQANEAGRTVGTHQVKAPLDLAMTKNSHIVWANPADHTQPDPNDSRIYEVNGEPHKVAGREHHKEAMLQLVTS